MAQVEGMLTKKVIGKGSKFEHMAMVLETAGRQYVVRRRGANPFETDNEWEGMVGKKVICEGTVPPSGTTGDYVMQVDSCRLAE